MADSRQSTAEFTRLVDQNGLVKLFANRVRARILATLLYADEPLSVARIADGSGITRSATIEALQQLTRFDVLEIDRPEEGAGANRTNTESTAEAPSATDAEGAEGVTDAFEDATIALADDDELVTAVRRVAELSTERFYEE